MKWNNAGTDDTGYKERANKTGGTLQKSGPGHRECPLPSLLQEKEGAGNPNIPVEVTGRDGFCPGKTVGLGGGSLYVKCYIKFLPAGNI